MFSMYGYTPELSTDLFIDTIQHTKRILTDKLITDEVLNKAAHEFMSAQTTWARMVSKNTFAITKHFVDSQTKFWFPK